MGEVIVSSVMGGRGIIIAENTLGWPSCFVIQGQIAVLVAISPIISKMLVKVKLIMIGMIWRGMLVNEA